MKEKNPLLVPELKKMISTGDSKALRYFCETAHPAIVADLISPLEGEEVWTVLQHADSTLRADIFSHLDEDIQVEIVEILSRVDIAGLLTNMAPDDRVDLFKQLPENIRESVLPAIAQAEREDIRRLIAYEEGTAGAVMTSDYATLSPQLTATQALERLREVAPDKETIYYAYVVDNKRKLLGFVSLKDLILSSRYTQVKNIMHPEVVFARVNDDQENAARKIQKYDLLALPVINKEDALVGIITHDDALDVITQEQTEDMEKLMAISGSHEDSAYMKTSIWGHFKNRSPWVIVLAVLGLISGFIVQSFESILLQVTVLAAFMPMLADTGGNTGSQSATLVVRALALKEISSRDILKILAREFCIALLLAMLLASMAYGRVFLFSGGLTIPESLSVAKIGLAVSTALGIQVITSTLVGALLPLGASKMKLDPAVVASPALTTVVDITGLLIFFTTAKIILEL